MLQPFKLVLQVRIVPADCQWIIPSTVRLCKQADADIWGLYFVWVSADFPASTNCFKAVAIVVSCSMACILIIFLVMSSTFSSIHKFRFFRSVSKFFRAIFSLPKINDEPFCAVLGAVAVKTAKHLFLRQALYI